MIAPLTGFAPSRYIHKLNKILQKIHRLMHGSGVALWVEQNFSGFPAHKTAQKKEGDRPQRLSLSDVKNVKNS